jgi:hypothetical protein
MTVQQPQSRVKVNRRGLVELALACAFLALLTFAVWSWQVDGESVVALGSALPEQQSALLPQIMRDPTIKLASVFAEFVLLLAVALAVAPPAWWLQAEHILGTEPVLSTTPLRWLGHVIQNSHNQNSHNQNIQGQNSQSETSNEQVATNGAGEPIYYQQPSGVVNPLNMPPVQPGAAPAYPPQTGQAQPGQPVPVPQVPGQPLPGQPQPGQPAPAPQVPGQPQPGQPLPGQAQPVPGQAATVTEVQPVQAAAPEATAPLAPLTEVLNFDEEATDDPLADLANIKDILSSAFDEDEGIDPDRLALANSLDEVDMPLIRTTARQIFATFVQ